MERHAVRQLASGAFAAETAALARAGGVAVNVSLSCSFGCPMEGDVPESAVLDWAARFVDLGVIAHQRAPAARRRAARSRASLPA